MGIFRRIRDFFEEEVYGPIVDAIEDIYRDIVSELGGLWGSDDLGEAVFGLSEEAERAFQQLQNLRWAELLPTGTLPSVAPYIGDGFYPTRVGWPFEIGIEAVSVAGRPAEGSFFIGHAPDCLFDALTMTVAGVPRIDDPRLPNTGFSARLVQRTPEGRTLFVSGYETGFDAQGTILREDLQILAISPLTAQITYGGPIETGLPLFIVVRPFGDFAPIPDFAAIQVQVTATLLVQEVAGREQRIGSRVPDRPRADIYSGKLAGFTGMPASGRGRTSNKLSL